MADKRRKGGDKERCEARRTKAVRRGRRIGDMRRGGSGGEERKKERRARRQRRRGKEEGEATVAARRGRRIKEWLGE
ncbi:hypothetical protein ACOSP7_001889 [Xanthoceras sorbifolium]